MASPEATARGSGEITASKADGVHCDYEPTVNDSPHPHASLMLGFVKTNLELSGSSFQSISLPMIENSALLSMSTRTPSCSTTSSNLPGFSTYSRW